MKTFNSLLLSLMIGTGALSAQNSVYSEITALLLYDSPSLSSQKAADSAELYSIKAENALEDPEVEFERIYGKEDKRWGLTVSQSFNWPGAYGARNKQASHAKAAFSALELSRQMEAELTYKKLLIDYVAAKKEAQMLDEVCQSLQELLKKYEVAWEKGETTILDLNKVKLEIVRSHSTHVDADLRAIALRNEIVCMSVNNGDKVALKLDELTDFPADRILSKEEYIEAIEASPMMTYYAEMEASSNYAEKLAGNHYPGFSVGYKHIFEDNSHFNGFSVGLSLPLWSRKSAKNSELAKKLSLSNESIGHKIQLRNMIESDYTTALSMKEQISTYVAIVENTNNIELLKKAFDGGEINLLNYLQEVSYFLEARIDYIKAHQAYATALAELNSIASYRNSI